MQQGSFLKYQILELPYEVIYIITEMLTINDIYSRLICLNSSALQLISSINFKKRLLRRYIPIVLHPLLNQKSLQNLQLILSSKVVKQKKPQELPFWGIRTNGGVAYHSLRFWIGKLFIKSKMAQVGIKKKVVGTFIEGALCTDTNTFKERLLKLNRLVSIILGHQNIPSKMSLIHIGNVFTQAYTVYTEEMLDQIDVNEEFFECASSLWNLINQLSDALTQAINVDQFLVEDKLHTKIPASISFITSIEINRKARFNELTKTIIVFTTTSETFPKEFDNKLNTCKTETDLVQLMKKQYNCLEEQKVLENELQIQRTNCLILNPYSKVFDKTNSTIDNYQSPSYCTFVPTLDRPVQPLLWVKFQKFHSNKPQTFIFKLKLQRQEQPICKRLHIRIIDTEKMNYVQGTESFEGIGLSYLRFKGYLLNQNTHQFTI